MVKFAFPWLVGRLLMVVLAGRIYNHGQIFSWLAGDQNPFLRGVLGWPFGAAPCQCYYALNAGDAKIFLEIVLVVPLTLRRLEVISRFPVHPPSRRVGRSGENNVY
jgi:hypothetical protein